MNFNIFEKQAAIKHLQAKDDLKKIEKMTKTTEKRKL